MEQRLPTHLEVSGLIRAVQSEGGFATVLSRGERDAGTVAIVTLSRSEPAQFYERMPTLDGTRAFTRTKTQDPEKPNEFNDYLIKRGRQDPDLWIVELDIADPARFAALQHK